MKRLIAKKSFKNKVNNIKLLMDLMYNNIKEAKIYPSVLGDALESLLEDNNKQKILGLLDKIRNEEPDCCYNGTVYRKFNFYIEDLVDDPKEIYYDELIYGIKENINTGYIQSSSESLKACEDFDTGYDGINIIVTYEVENAVSIHKLLEKYYYISRDAAIEIEENEYNEKKYGETEDDMMEAFVNMEYLYNMFSSEEEILGIMPNDYKILKINDIDIDNLLEVFDESFLKK
jgi:hypothetical protein